MIFPDAAGEGTQDSQETLRRLSIPEILLFILKFFILKISFNIYVSVCGCTKKARRGALGVLWLCSPPYSFEAEPLLSLGLDWQPASPRDPPASVLPQYQGIDERIKALGVIHMFCSLRNVFMGVMVTWWVFYLLNTTQTRR